MNRFFGVIFRTRNKIFFPLDFLIFIGFILSLSSLVFPFVPIVGAPVAQPKSPNNGKSKSPGNSNQLDESNRWVTPSLASEDEVQFAVGGSAQGFQSRYTERKESNKVTNFGEMKWEGLAILGESRGERSLGSFAYKNDYINLGLGHRYKSIPGFFLGKDPEFYNTLGENQPLTQSAFLNFLPGYFSPGIFLSSSITGDKPGFSFVFPENKIAVTYSPETEKRSLYTNFYRTPIKLTRDMPKILFSLNGEAMGTRTDYFGSFHTKIEETNSRFYVEGISYKDDNGFLLQSQDSFQSNPENAINSWAAVGIGPYHRIEAFDSVQTGQRERFRSIRWGIWETFLGNPTYRYRDYSYWSEIRDERFEDYTRADAILWMYHGKNIDWLIGREIRSNGDRTTEAGLNFRGNGWKLETNVLFQAETNEFRSPIERFSGYDTVQIALTDRAKILRFRFRTEFLEWNITSSERVGRAGSFLFMNLQYNWVF